MKNSGLILRIRAISPSPFNEETPANHAGDVGRGLAAAQSTGASFIIDTPIRHITGSDDLEPSPPSSYACFPADQVQLRQSFGLFRLSQPQPDIVHFGPLLILIES